MLKITLWVWSKLFWQHPLSWEYRGRELASNFITMFTSKNVVLQHCIQIVKLRCRIKEPFSRYISSYSFIYSQMGVSNMHKNRNLSYYFFIHISTIYKIWTKCIIKRLSTSMMISKLLRKWFILFNFSGYLKIFKTNTKINKL